MEEIEKAIKEALKSTPSGFYLMVSNHKTKLTRENLYQILDMIGKTKKK